MFGRVVLRHVQCVELLRAVTVATHPKLSQSLELCAMFCRCADHNAKRSDPCLVFDKIGEAVTTS